MINLLLNVGKLIIPQKRNKNISDTKSCEIFENYEIRPFSCEYLTFYLLYYYCYCSQEQLF